MLTIKQKQLDTIIEQSFALHPIEACGVISGLIGSDNPLTVIPMDNSAKSETFFRFCSKQQLKVWREMDEHDHEVIVFYHSHTNSRAYPSKEDIKFSIPGKSHHLIVSTDQNSHGEIRSYRFVNGRAVEETLKII